MEYPAAYTGSVKALQAWLLPAGTDPGAAPLLLARGLRALGDGCMAVLLPAYLLALGWARWTSASSAPRRWRVRRSRPSRSAPTATASPRAGFASFWPLLVVAFVGTLNPSSGDVSVFLPLEHARLAGAARGTARTALFARYSLLGALCAAVGALGAAAPTGNAPPAARRGVNRPRPSDSICKS